VTDATGTADRPVRIETERLVLDAHTADDLDAMAAMWADPDVVRHAGGTPSSRAESWGRLLRYRGLWPLLGYGYWAVREKSSGRFIGDLGFADFHREIEPPILGIPEGGWAFASPAQGRGFAAEALSAALTWLDGTGRFERSVCLIAPENIRSIRLAERNGFVPWMTVTFRGRPTLLLSRGRDPVQTAYTNRRSH
jgi:RimJ/RimL family protein N-acetyltransferase